MEEIRDLSKLIRNATNEDFIFEYVISKGSYKTVCCVRAKNSTQADYVAKIIPVAMRYKNLQRRVKQEIELSHKISNSNYVERVVHAYSYSQDTDEIYFLIIAHRYEPFPFNKQSFTRNEVLKIGIDVCKGLEALDGVRDDGIKTILHRDIKPDNILYNPRTGCYLITDFGSVKEISGTFEEFQTVVPAVTYSYAAPEYCVAFADENHNYKSFAKKYKNRQEAEKVINRAQSRRNMKYRNCDVFSLGVTLFYLLTERFPRDYNNQIRQAPNVDDQLAAVISKAIEDEPRNRYHSIAELETDLKRLQKGENVIVKKPKPLLNGIIKYFAPLRNKVIALFIVVACIIGSAWFGLTAYQKKHMRDLYDQANRYMEDGKYDDASEIYGSLNDYEDSESKLEEIEYLKLKKTLAQALDEGRYEYVINYIRENADLSNEDVYSYYSSVCKKYIDHTVERISKFEKNDDFASIFTELDAVNETLDDNSELQNLITTYENMFNSYVKKKVRGKQYKEALSIINDALDIHSDDYLLSLYDEIQELQPISLSELEVFDYGTNGEDNVLVDNATTDRYNNNYTTSFAISFEDTVTWLLSGEYKTFKGVVSCPKDEMPKPYRGNVIMRIYCDGKKVYQSKESGPYEKPQTFSVNLTGVEKLSIKWEYVKYNICTWCDYATIFDSEITPATDL